MYLLVTMLALVICFMLSKNKRGNKKPLIICNTIIAIVYIIWRITTIPTESLQSFVFGMCLYVAEMIGLSQFFIFQFLFIKKHKIIEMTLDEYKGKLPTVDILICTYNESVDLLEKTIVGALNINYPNNLKTVNVCDDGKRDNVKRLCEKYNVNWITRDNNEGAKAGNINSALKQLNGELFAVFDADMIADKKFLAKTVGYFKEKETAFVQTPQCYYNQDMYQYNLNKNIPNEQDFFMRDVQEARASINAVLHVGTNAVFRREYVDSIGGYPTCSITEDMAVGMKLQSQGYKSVFINEVLALGLSATTYADLVSQRDRWCRGNLQVFAHFNPLFEKGLDIKQKIAYCDGVIYWFSSIQKMIFILAPILYLIFGTLILKSDTKDILNMFLPFLLGQVLIFKSFSPKTRTIKWSHYYEVAMAPHISFSIIRQLLSLNTKFNVTPKDVSNDTGYFQFKVALPHIILLIASLIACTVGTYNLIIKNIGLGAYVVNIGWCLYNLIAIVLSIRVAYQKPIYRKTERVSTLNEMWCSIFRESNGKSIRCRVLDLSDKAMKVKVSKKINGLNKGDTLTLLLDEGVSLLVNVIRVHADEVVVRFADLTEDAGRIIMDLYISNMKPYYYVDKKPVYIKRKSKEVKI